MWESPSSVAQGCWGAACSAARAREPSQCGLQALPWPAPRGPLTQADDCERRPGARRPLRPRGRALLHAGASRARAPAALRPGLRLGLGLARRLRPGCGRRLRRRLCAAAVQARNARGHIGRGVTGPAGAQRRSPGRTVARRCPRAAAGSPSPACARRPPARPCPGAPCPSVPGPPRAAPHGAKEGASVGPSVLPPGPSPEPGAGRPRRASHVTRPPSRSGADRAGGRRRLGRAGGHTPRLGVLDSSTQAALARSR